MKDSTVITLLFFTWFLIACGVLGAENEISRLENQIQEVYGNEGKLMEVYLQVAEKNAEQDQNLVNRVKMSIARMVIDFDDEMVLKVIERVIRERSDEE